MPLCLRSFGLPLLSLCPPCSPPKLLQLTARPHLNATTKNIQTSSERCEEKWQKVLQPQWVRMRVLEQLPLPVQLGTDPWGGKGLTTMQGDLSSSPHCCSVFIASSPGMP